MSGNDIGLRQGNAGRELRTTEVFARPMLWTWALCVAVLAGLGEAALVAIVRSATGRLILISPEVVWMAPLANAAIFGIAAFVLKAAAPALGGVRAAGAASFVFVFLLLLGPLLIVPRLHPYAALILGIGIAVQTARIVPAHTDTINRAARWILPAAVSLSAVLGAGVFLRKEVQARNVEAALPPAADGAPNVILIVLDTVRARSLSLYGAHRQTSPRLAEFARTGVVFDRALSTSPWTLPSHASFFTGRQPHELSADWLTPLNSTQTTLAEAFSARGYTTAGFVANLLYTTAESGLNRGFARYSDFPMSIGRPIRESWLARALWDPLRRFVGDSDRLVRKRAADVNREFDNWMTSRAHRPFFVFLNYFDAHEPYMPPPPFDRMFGDGGRQPDIAVRRSWSPDEIQRSQDAYDGTLAYLDEQIGMVLAKLRAERILENTIVIVTADHGEQFGEHGVFDHGNSLYWVVLHVPLVISFPGNVPAGIRIPDPVSLVDLPATILDLANSASAASGLRGRSLAEYWRTPRRREKQAPLIAEVSKAINMPEWLPASKGDMRSVVSGTLHYIRNGDGREELYDFERDPDELNDLSHRGEFHSAIEEARQSLAEAQGELQ